MTALTNQYVDAYYGDLLQVSNSGSGVDGTLRAVSSALGTSTPLQLSSTYVNITALKYNSHIISVAGAFTFSGAYSFTATLTNTTAVTFPTSGTLSTLDGSETLTNKTLVAPILGTPASGTLTSCTGLPLTTGITGTLALTHGGTGVTASDPILQRVSTITTGNTSGTTQIPLDNTIPQITEGDQYLSQAITPKSATSVLEIEACLLLSASTATTLTVALFQDSTANALAATAISIPAQDKLFSVPLKFFMTSGTTSATTFKVRVGPSGSATTYFNTVNANALYNSTAASYICIKEWAT
jgi:hypothetical protein